MVIHSETHLGTAVMGLPPTRMVFNVSEEAPSILKQLICLVRSTANGIVVGH